MITHDILAERIAARLKRYFPTSGPFLEREIREVLSETPGEWAEFDDAGKVIREEVSNAD